MNSLRDDKEKRLFTKIMTKKQSTWFFILGIIYSALVGSLGGIHSDVLSHILGLISLSYVFWVLVVTERKGYAK